MTEAIGAIYETAIPSISDVADIQEALRIYHYGAPSSIYAPGNTEPGSLVQNSIAAHLYGLDFRIRNFAAGVQPTTWTAKGDLITATAAGIISVLPLGQNDQVLTVNTAEDNGLKWTVPQITATNAVVMSNKILQTTSISSPGITFNAPSGNNFKTLLGLIAPTADRTILLPDASTTLVGTNTAQSLTFKTINLNTPGMPNPPGGLSGTNTFEGALAIANGGTGSITAGGARAALQIFVNQTAATAADDRSYFSGKIYIANPSIVGTTGANIDGAATNDLWFW